MCVCVCVLWSRGWLVSGLQCRRRLCIHVGISVQQDMQLMCSWRNGKSTAICAHYDGV